ncbi:MAG: hypothetical protein NTY64_02155 [Deltaproteobacteria bacterium]|nr:hypothetical protein [Deltaproteobacteria bacterium]
MKWIEVINLRTAGQERTRRLQEIIQELMFASLRVDGLTDIKIYNHAAVDTDLGIHLRWDSATIATDGSALAMQIADVLQDFGLVYSDVWVEQPVTMHPEHSKK